MSRNSYGIAGYKIYGREAVIGGRKYQLLVATNSTLKEVKAERSACSALKRACKEQVRSKIIGDAMKLFSVRPLISENCECCAAVGAIRAIPVEE